MTKIGTRQLNIYIEEYPTDKKLQKDKEISLAVLAARPLYAEFTDVTLKKDRDIILTAVKADGRALMYFPDEVRGNEEYALAAVSDFCRSYAYVTGEAKKSREVALAVAKSGGDAIELLPEEFKGDKEVCLTAVSRNPKTLVYFTEELKSDKDVALAVVAADRTAVKLLSDEAFSHTEVVNAVLKTVGGAASPNTLSNDTPLGLFYAIEERGIKVNLATQNVSPATLEREKLAVVIKVSGGTLPRKNEIFKKYLEADDREIISAMINAKMCPPSMIAEGIEVASKGRRIRVLPVLLQAKAGVKKTFDYYETEAGERTKVIKSLKRGSLQGVKRFFDDYEKYKDDRELVYLAVKTDGRILPDLKSSKFFGEEELTDEAIANYIVKNSEEPLLKRLEGFELTKAQAHAACRRDGRNYFYLPEKYRLDKDVAAEAVKTDKTVYSVLPDEMKDDPKIKWNYRL